MIEELKNDDIVDKVGGRFKDKVGGRFKLAALMQKRWLELMQGSRPMVDLPGGNELEIIAREIMSGKIVAKMHDPSSSDEESSAGDDTE